MGLMNNAMNTLPANNNSRQVSASLPTVTTVGKVTTYRNLKGRNRKFQGKHFEGEVAVGNHAVVTTGESVTLWGVQTRRTTGLAPYRLTFKVGDFAVYDSYNLVYTGLIVAIGAKTVTIEASCTGRKSAKQLSIAEFSRRNWNYNAEKISRQNSDWID